MSEFRKARGCDSGSCPAGRIVGRRLETADVDSFGQPTSPVRTVTAGELRFAAARKSPEDAARRVLPKDHSFTQGQLEIFGRGLKAGEFAVPRSTRRRSAHVRG